MQVKRFFAAFLALGVACAQPALAAPVAFTATGVATTIQDGKSVQVPNKLYFDHGRIRLEMSPPADPEGGPAFTVVLASEGADVITLLNPAEKQAMKIQASTLEGVMANPSLQKISQFNLSEFGRTFRAQGKKIGVQTVAGEPCTILEQKGKDGHFLMWLSDKHEIPFKFIFMQGGKPAFDYQMQSFSPSAGLAESSYGVPSGYQVIDMSEMLKGMESGGKQ